jgi:glutaminase
MTGCSARLTINATVQENASAPVTLALHRQSVMRQMISAEQPAQEIPNVMMDCGAHNMSNALMEDVFM